MDNNLFSDKQIEYLYSDSGFLSFVNKYFSSFSTCLQDIDYSLRDGDENDIDIEIYLRIVLANIETLHGLISDLENCLSMSHVDKEVIYSGEIQGRLNISKYSKSVAQSRFPKEYPCVVKAKTYVTPENVYAIFIIKNVLKMLDGFKMFLTKKGNSTIYTELGLIENHSKAFRMFTTKAYFRECQSLADQIIKSHGENYPEELRNLIFNRIHKGKIRNSQIYRKVFEWYNIYRQGSVLAENTQKLSVLRYSDDFANRLFELWCLYSIKETFISSFDAVLIEEKDIMEVGDGYVFKLMVPTGGTLEIYYQKGADLYWKSETDLIWKYKKDDKARGLRGIPDISIRYSSKEDALVMIDIKNRVRSAGSNSEEIYKMIGYFGNFKKAFEEYYSQNVKKQGALIFRNDMCASEELLESENGYRLMAISAGINSEEEINKKQFVKLCKYVLDVQGIDGTTSEIMGNFSQAQKSIGISVDPSSDEYIYELTERNHSTIQQLFSYGELAEQLPQYKERLEKDHFPHIWTQLAGKTQDILAMAECLYSGVSDCDTADYAPICLEYCRALEVEMNELIFIPFKASANILRLAQQNFYYDKLKETREMTLGECVFLLDKCSHRSHPLIELKRSVQTNVKQNQVLLGSAISILRGLNENVRRLSAHTTVMSYEDLVSTRQRVLGIGNLNLFYTLRDNR